MTDFISSAQKINHRNLIQSVSDRYNVRKTKGSAINRALIDFRAAWITAGGLTVTTENTANQEFIDRFNEYNKIEDVAFRAWVTSGEVEGRNLLVLTPKKSKDGTTDIKVNAISWIFWQYDVISLTLDPDDYERIWVPQRQDIPERFLSNDETVYVKLAGEQRFVNSPVPVAGAVDEDIEAIEDAFADLRKYNRKFGGGFPFFSTENRQDANELTNQLKKHNWVPGSILAAPKTTGSYISPPNSGIDNIREEIAGRIERITGASGVPVHFMGYIRMFSTKAGAEETTQTLNARTENERKTWEDKIKELYQKAMTMYNAANNASLDIEDIDVEIHPGTIGQLETIATAFLPLQQAGIISKDAVRQRIPDYDIEEDKKELEKEAAEAQAAKTAALSKVTNDIFGTTPGPTPMPKAMEIGPRGGGVQVVPKRAAGGPKATV